MVTSELMESVLSGRSAVVSGRVDRGFGDDDDDDDDADDAGTARIPQRLLMLVLSLCDTLLLTIYLFCYPR